MQPGRPAPNKPAWPTTHVTWSTNHPTWSTNLSGGVKASNIYWQVGTSATLDGRALARIAAVTMDANLITIPAP